MDVADEARFCLRKLMVMFYYERAGFKREFLEINGIHIHGLKHSVRASPRNERFWGVQRSGHGAIYRRKSGAVERQNLQRKKSPSTFSLALSSVRFCLPDFPLMPAMGVPS